MLPKAAKSVVHLLQFAMAIALACSTLRVAAARNLLQPGNSGSNPGNSGSNPGNSGNVPPLTEDFWNQGSGVAADHGPGAKVQVQWARDAYAEKVRQINANAEAAGNADSATLPPTRRKLLGGSPRVLMSYHNGKIMTTAVTQSIFWGPKWQDPTFVGDKITGLESFYTGFSSSNYAKTCDEYTGLKLQVAPLTTHNPAYVTDLTTAAGGGSTSAILAEVCKSITPDPAGNGYYSVYTDLPRGSAGYCAWHSSGICNGVPVQFAFFWNLDGDGGCDPQDTTTGHSQGLAALANVSGHELSEARTDPASPGAWYDSSGAENADKCAWTFKVPPVTFSDGSVWKLQGEWSNKAYSSGTGYANSSGQKGCIAGQ